MYRKKSRGWYKHKDFIFLDLVCLFLSLILAYLVRNGSVRNIFELGIYHNMIFFVILIKLANTKYRIDVKLHKQPNYSTKVAM